MTLPAPRAAFGASANETPAEPTLETRLRTFFKDASKSDDDRRFAGSLLDGIARWGALTDRQEAAALRMLDKPAPGAAVAANPLATSLRAALPNLGEKDREFATSLLAGFDKFGRFTDRQLPYAEKLARQGNAPKEQVSTTVLTALTERFNLARASGLKAPSFTLTNAKVGMITITAAKAESRNPGCLYVSLGDTYVGKVSPSGEWQPTREAPANLGAILSDIGGNLAERAAAYGHATGNCCFCSRDLTDPRSVTVGYGPICAGHYGLPWGEVAPRFTCK